MRYRSWTTIGAAAVVAACVSGLSLGANHGTPLAALGLAAEQQTKVERGDAVVMVLPADRGELAVAGAARVATAPDRLVAWMRVPEQLYRGRYVSSIGRFSDPPVLDDLAALVLPPEDLEAIRRCRPGKCDVKLSAAEMGELRGIVDRSGRDWERAVAEGFRHVMLRRATAYLADADRGVRPYHDGDRPVSPGDEFEAIARHGAGGLPGARALSYFAAFPDASEPHVESYLYWSLETLGTGKPIATITHTAIFRDAGPGGAMALAAARQVYATHYLTGSLSLTALRADGHGSGYLMYIRRSRADILHGPLAPLVRRVVQSRVTADAPAVLDEMRRRLESGEPAAAE